MEEEKKFTDAEEAYQFLSGISKRVNGWNCSLVYASDWRDEFFIQVYDEMVCFYGKSPLCGEKDITIYRDQDEFNENKCIVIVKDNRLCVSCFGANGGACLQLIYKTEMDIL